jgi:hypothetical protein
MHQDLSRAQCAFHCLSARLQSWTLVGRRAKGLATSVTFWENSDGERASRMNIPGLIERMANVLASNEVYQETFECVHDQYLPAQREGVGR